MHAIVIFLLQVFANEKFRTWAAETLQNFIEKLLRSEVKKRKRKAARKSKKKRKKKKMTDPNHVQQIQNLFRERIPNPDSAILTKEGVYAEVNLEEGGLNAAEGSFGGVHPRTWGEYRSTIAQDITVANPADFENLPAEEVVQLITDFKNWYFQKPPAQNFFALPSLLWLVVCDAAYLAPAPVVSRIQRLVGCETVDGIWGSGTTAQVKDFFAGKTVPDMVQFAMDFTDLIIKRYAELAQYPQHAENAAHWTDRAERKMNTLLEFVNRQNEMADAGKPPETEVPVNELRQQASPNGEGPDSAPDPVTEAPPPPIETPEPEMVTMPLADFNHLISVVSAQTAAVDEMRTAILTHVEMQEKILETLSELPSQPPTEAAPPEKPLTPREELNVLPDSLVP